MTPEIKRMKMEEDEECMVIGEEKTDKKEAIGVQLDGETEEKGKLQTASKGMIHAAQPPPPNLTRADTLSVSELGVDSTDESSDEEKTLKGKGKDKGGKMRKIHIDKDDAYGWWIMGIDMMEQGMSQHLSGLVLMRKAAMLMADKDDEMKNGMD